MLTFFISNSSPTNSPYFQQTLKAGTFLSHLVWIMGPLSGLVVAPLVGVLSDRCTLSFGRRRPFMLGGMIACIIGMNLFSNAPKITMGYLPAARWLAFFAFGILDFATNAIMFPSRALLGDLLPAHEQHAVQSAAAVVASMAEICAGLYMWTWKDPVTHVRTVFFTASLLLAGTCAVSLFVCKEEALKEGEEEVQFRERTEDHAEEDEGGDEERLEGEKVTGLLDEQPGEGSERRDEVRIEDTERDLVDMGNEEEDDVENRLSLGVGDAERPSSRAEGGGTRGPEQERSQKSVLGDVIATLRSAITTFPRGLVTVGIVYGLAWFVWFASLPFYSNWLGKDVLGGDPQAEDGTQEAMKYQQGVVIFSVANVAKAGMAMVFSAFYPRIIGWVGSIGERLVFGASFLGFGVVLWMFADTKNVMVAGTVVALGAIPFIVTQTIPIAILVQRFPDNLASNLGVLNLFCVVPQLVDTIYTGKIAEMASESVVLKVAGCWALAAAVAALLFL